MTNLKVFEGYENRRRKLESGGFLVGTLIEIGLKSRKVYPISPKNTNGEYPLFRGEPFPLAYLLPDGNIRFTRWKNNPELVGFYGVLNNYKICLSKLIYFG